MISHQKLLTKAGLLGLLVASAYPAQANGAKTVEFNLPGQSVHSFSPLACATEGGHCTVANNTTIAYGGGEKFQVVVRSGTFACNNASMGGDPAPGVSKSCYVPSSALGRKQVERLDRGAIAINRSWGNYIGWRLLGTESRNTAFNVYATTSASDNGPWTLLTVSPLMGTTNYVHNKAGSNQRYRIVPVLNGVEQVGKGATVALQANDYIDIPVTPPVPTMPGVNYRITEASPGDLRGKGDYDLVVKWEPNNTQDNANPGMTDKTYLDGYTFHDGNPRRLWRIDLGINIRSGAHYTPFTVYDLNGDGRAEVAVRIAHGSTQGDGGVLNRKGTVNGAAVYPDYRIKTPGKTYGKVLEGEEWLAIFDGATGKRLAQVDYFPDRGPRAQWPSTWGDDFGNRMDRFGAAVAYLDGTTPSLIIQRGYYERTVLTAWKFTTNNQLQRQWTFDTHAPDGDRSYAQQGAHHLVVADLNQDGRDEIVLGAAVIGHDGKPFNNSTKGHGDHMQVSDFDPKRPGLEIFTVHEALRLHKGTGMMLRQGHDSRIIWERGVCNGKSPVDVAKGMMLDIDPDHIGAEGMSFDETGWQHGLVFANGTNHPNGCEKGADVANNAMALYWDGDLLRETISMSFMVRKWDPAERYQKRIMQFPHDTFSGAEKSQPILVADLLGDWREEVMLYKYTDKPAIRIYTTTTKANTVMADGVTPVPAIPTLMHDPQYRLAVATQNVGYNESPNPSFYLGDGMASPVVRYLRTVGSVIETSPQPEMPRARVHLHSALNEDMCLNANTMNPDSDTPAVSLWKCVNVPQQRWTLTTHNGKPVVKVGNGDGMCLQASNARVSAGTGLHTWPCDQSSVIGGGQYILNAKQQLEAVGSQGQCVAVNNHEAVQGNHLLLWPCDQVSTHRWILRD